tara:strand:+ start:112 stop:1086 length:975 start_codon:yes stop_codon:yes gene_type:complete
MTTPTIFVKAARKIWSFVWNILMNGLAPSDEKGNYVRPENIQKIIQIPTSEDLKNRDSEHLPYLIIGESCPWAHRAWIMYEIKGLNKSINLHIAKVDSEGGRWIFEPKIFGCKSLQDLYKKCGNHQSKRATVPILFDPGRVAKSKFNLINNESAELVKILNNWPSKNNDLDMNPKHCEKSIINWHKLIQENINNGVYKCGFARNQEAYEKASESLFSALRIIEESLNSNGPWLCGKDLTIADVRLFPTLIRWETIYDPLFKCSVMPITLFPNIIEWRKNFFNMVNIKKTCRIESWRKDYFGALFPLNPSGIVPKGQSLEAIISS